ncbi:TPA: hypothetical protein ACOBSY_003190, partial [Enterococcus faecium]
PYLIVDLKLCNRTSEVIKIKRDRRCDLISIFYPFLAGKMYIYERFKNKISCCLISYCERFG